MLRKSIQYENSGPMHEFKLASAAYKAACREFTRIRIAASHPMSTTEQIVALHRARPVYKQDCQIYAEARAAYINSVQLIAQAKVTPISNRTLASLTVEANEKAITDEIRKEAIIKDFGGNEAVQQIVDYLAERQRNKAEGFDPMQYEEATKPIAGNTFAFESSEADPVNLDSDPFGDDTLRARGVK